MLKKAVRAIVMPHDPRFFLPIHPKVTVLLFHFLGFTRRSKRERDGVIHLRRNTRQPASLVQPNFRGVWVMIRPESESRVRNVRAGADEDNRERTHDAARPARPR